MKGKIAGAALIVSISLWLAATPATADNQGSQAGPGLTSFKNPMYQGARLDWCLKWGEECGTPAASAWCKQKNFSSAHSWQVAPDIGGTAHTKVFSSGQVCNQPFCDGFKEIVCNTAEPGIILDFEAKAPQAKWTNAWQQLPFPGSPGDSKGFVRYLDDSQLEDGRVYRRALETHPHWQPRGRIVGRFANITVPQDGAEFRAQIGFMHGATGSDGAYFEIWAEFPGYAGIPLRREYYKKYGGYLIDDFSQDLSRFRGMTGTIALSVEAGEKSSAQDWAVWVKPRLVSMKNEFKFGGVAGAAAGSGRNGSKLVNPWGGKSGYLFGDIILYFAFADDETQLDHSLSIISYHNGQSLGKTDLGMIKAGQKELWKTISRTQEGAWREEIIFNGTYSGEIRYTISKTGE